MIWRVTRAFAAAICFGLAADGSAAELNRAMLEICANSLGTDASFADGLSACDPVRSAYAAAGTSVPVWLLKANAEGVRDLALILPPDLPQAAAPLDPAAVAEIVRKLQPQTSASSKSLWDRILEWFDHWMNPAEADDRFASFLRDLIKHLHFRVSPVVAVSMLWLMLALLAATLVYVVYREVQVAGVTGPWKRALGRSTAVATSAAEREIVNEPVQDHTSVGRAAAALQGLIKVLATRGLLPADEALTNHELARLLEPDRRSVFLRLLGHIEPSLYGGRSLGEPELAVVLELIDGLESSV